jgi:fucose 4-O-acetylase-like acetyltransferase
LFLAVDNSIYLFHIPVFFVLSGLVFERGALRDGFWLALLKRAESQVYPLILWSYITALPLFFFAHHLNEGGISGIGALLLYPFPPKGVFWFLAALFLVQTFASLFVGRLTRGQYLLLLVALIVGVYVVDIPSLRIFIESAPWFFVGLVLARAKLTVTPVVAMLGGVLFVLVIFWACQQDAQLVSPYNFAPGMVATLSFLIVCRWAFASRGPIVNRCLAELGHASMAIYVSHVIALAAARIALVMIDVTSIWLHVVVGTVIGVVGPYLMFILARHFGLLPIFGLGRQPKPQLKEA